MGSSQGEVGIKEMGEDKGDGWGLVGGGRDKGMGLAE